MNTVFVCNLVILVVVLTNYHQGEAALTLADTEKLRLKCVKEVNLNVDEAKRIYARELYSPKYSDTSDNLKCWLLCFHKKGGLIDSDMKMNMEGFNELFVLYFPEKKDKVKNALTKCSSVKATKPCEMAYDFNGCVLTNLA